jgi:hypothetical protein
MDPFRCCGAAENGVKIEGLAFRASEPNTPAPFLIRPQAPWLRPACGLSNQRVPWNIGVYPEIVA